MPCRRACRLLSLSPIADDPRVRSMGDALSAAGWDVVGIGLPGGRATPPAWPVLTPPLPENIRHSEDVTGIAERIGGKAASILLAPAEGLLKLSNSPYATLLGAVRTRMSTADRPLSEAYHSLARRSKEAQLTDDEKMRARYWRLSSLLQGMEAIASQLDGPALWIANDWWMLPIADAGQSKAGGVVVYDSHELATEEFAEVPHWQKFQRPIVSAIEASLIKKAKIVTSVSPGISRHLRDTYALDMPVMTLRNTPRYQETAFRPAGEKIRVLYHGLVRPGRGLEATIRSVPRWRSEFTLVVRGPSEQGYIETLSSLAREVGADTRITFEPPVAVTELVKAASTSDIGIMALPDLSLQTRYALPNKLFEYLMAGLAIAVTDLPEMAALVRETGAGATIAASDPDAIAATINSFTRDQLDGMKRAALKASQLHCWEKQSAPVIAAYGAAMDEYNHAVRN